MLVISGVVSTVGSGGGGGGLGLNIPYPPTFSAPIITPVIASMDVTAANAQDVSATAVQAHDHALHVAAIIGGQVFPRLPGAPGLLSSNSKFELFDAAVTTGDPVTGACTISGMVTASPAAETGVANLVFDTCDDGDGYIIDGRFSLKVRELDGDPRTDVFLLDYSLKNMALTIASGTDSYAASVGTLSDSLRLDSRAFPVVVLSHGFANLQLGTQADVYSWYNGGNQTLTLNAGLSPVTKILETDGALMSSTFLGGSIYYDTIVPLQATDNQAPESGEILIDGGTGKGTVRIVIESASSVRLEIDTNGNGTIDDYLYTTWAALRG